MSYFIGISGYARSGKTTVADYIEAKYSVERRHIAAPLREMLKSLLAAAGVPFHMRHRYLEGDLKEHVIPEIGKSGRDLQITLGTEWGRRLVRDDLWADLWARGCPDELPAMNDSVRFPNEEVAIRRRPNSFTILVVRPGTHPISYKWGSFGRWLYRRFWIMWGVHDSERVDRLRLDYVIENSGSLLDLYSKVDRVMTERGIYPIDFSSPIDNS